MADRAKDYGDFERMYRHLDGALKRGTVYILHFEWEVPEEWWREDEQHYIGWTGDLDNRMLKHVILESGSAITISRRLLRSALCTRRRLPGNGRGRRTSSGGMGRVEAV